MSTRTKLRLAIVAAATTGLLGASVLGTGSAAQASGGLEHQCGMLVLPPFTDDGPLTDPLHHTVEPLIPEGVDLAGFGSGHQLFCGVQSSVDAVTCLAPAQLAFLRGTFTLPCPA